MLQFPKVMQAHFPWTALNDAKGTVDKYRQKQTHEMLFSICLVEKKEEVLKYRGVQR